MTTKQTFFQVAKITHACIFAGAMFCCSQSWGVEPMPPKTNIALEKLQDFGHRAAEFSTRASELALHAMGMIGIHYKYGGNTPESGLDCSGLVRYVFKEAWGSDLPRTAVEISRVGETISQKDLQPGDLVFYNTLKRGFSHVGIYLGNSKFIHSPSAGGRVRIESMEVSYWKQRFNGARRINEPAAQ